MAAKGTKAKGGKEYGSKARKAEGKALRKSAKTAAIKEATFGIKVGVATVSRELAEAFGMKEIPGLLVIEEGR